MVFFVNDKRESLLPPGTSPFAVCEQVFAQHDQAVQVSKSLLETLAKNHSLISLDYTPLETFAKEESVRLLTDVLKRLAAIALSREDVKEHIENIVASFRLYRDRYSVEGAVMAMRCLRAFIVAVCDLCYLLELTGGQSLTNWDECSKLCEEQLRKLQIRSAYRAVEYIPTIKDFKSVRTLGGGGFGVVYEAIHIPTGSRVCIKLVITSRLKRLSYAALDKIVASVSEHPKLVLYLASFLTTQAYVTVMEYVGGVDVLKFIVAIGEITHLPGHYGVILHQMVKAVAHMHAHGFIHRDIKPQNTLLLPGGHIKLIDFDTCKICAGHFVDTHPLSGYFSRTAYEFEDRDYAGTVSFMPPEVIEHRPYGRAVDWWAIGVTAYRLILGKMPFRDKDRDRVKVSICHSTVQYPDSLPGREKDFIEGLLTKDSQNRLGSRNYSELIHHRLFDEYCVEKPLDESYFDTSKIQELLQALRRKSSKKSRLKAKAKAYLELKECADVPIEDQKNLLVFASIPWRMLTRAEEAICPEKSDADLERELDALLEAQDIVAADVFPSSWINSETSQREDTNASSSNLTGGQSSLLLNSRLNSSVDVIFKGFVAPVDPLALKHVRRAPSKRKRKTKKCSIM